MAIAGFGLALLPDPFLFSSALKLEPYCLCFILIGATVIFSSQERTDALTTRALVTGGLLFGFAALVKLWAFFPFLALVICLVPRLRSRILVLVGSAAAGLLLPSLPFIALAPSKFVSQVLITQLARRPDLVERATIFQRLSILTGFGATHLAPTHLEIVIGLIALIAVVTLAHRRRMKREAVDVYLLIATVVTALGLLIAPDFYYYYGDFLAPFLVGVVAVSIARLSIQARTFVRGMPVTIGVRQLATTSASAAGVVLVGALVLYLTTFYSFFLRWNGIYPPWISAIAKVVPAGSCVTYSDVFYGIFTDRLVSSSPHCPNVVDVEGMWLSRGNHSVTPSNNFVTDWKAYFQSSKYVVLTEPKTSTIPWNASLTSWFEQNYHLVYGEHHLFIYRR